MWKKMNLNNSWINITTKKIKMRMKKNNKNKMTNLAVKKLT
jgi:hypothetical protein